jgi:hypothetical protein
MHSVISQKAVNVTEIRLFGLRAMGLETKSSVDVIKEFERFGYGCRHLESCSIIGLLKLKSPKLSCSNYSKLPDNTPKI